MSTLFTIETPQPVATVPQLGLQLLAGQQWLMLGLSRLMRQRGHGDLTPAHLMFLSNLDCGETFASEVARRMGVSRQAVYRTTREMQRLGVLTLEPHAQRRTQKIIRMTDRGRAVVADARACLDMIEGILRDRLGETDLASLANILSRDWGQPAG